MKIAKHWPFPRTRAPNGYPEFTERFCVRFTPKQQKKIKARGGSAWVRDLVNKAP